MKQVPYQSIKYGFGCLLFLVVCLSCSKEDNAPNLPLGQGTSIVAPDEKGLDATILSQTKTGNLFNNFGEDYANIWYQAGYQYFSANDDSYAYSKKMSRGRGSLALLLQDFRFDIPSNATIENIVVTARRFKTGRGSVTDYFATLIRRLDINERSNYGVRFTNPDPYPNTETEIIYSQTGTGNNGGLEHNEFYQWTPAMVNDSAFGVIIQNFQPAGSVVIYYDLVQITVEYSLP